MFPLRPSFSEEIILIFHFSYIFLNEIFTPVLPCLVSGVKRYVDNKGDVRSVRALTLVTEPNKVKYAAIY